MPSIVKENTKSCGNDKCSSSSGFDGEITFGSGYLSYWGYWSNPCLVCAKAWAKKEPEWAEQWGYWPMFESQVIPMTAEEIENDKKIVGIFTDVEE